MADLNTCTYLGFIIKIKSENLVVCCGCVVSENYFPPTRIENTCYSSHHENMVHHSTIRPASYKRYGHNNTKPPRPPHCNTIIDVVGGGV